jgi:hypothetical protein
MPRAAEWTRQRVRVSLVGVGGGSIRTVALAAVIGTALMLGVPVQAGHESPHTTLTSIGNSGPAVAGSSSTFWRSLSANGRKAVFSVDDDALPGADGTTDVYLRDLRRHRTILVSRNSSGAPANDDSSDDESISGSGRFVAFVSGADNLPGGVGGIFVRDLKKGKTELASKTTGGTPAAYDGDLRYPDLSAEGRFVSFQVNDDDLPGADGTSDVYVRDREQDKLVLASQTSDGQPVDDDAGTPTISGNGRFVGFQSSSDLLPGDDATGDVFLRNLKKKITVLVSREPDGDPASFSFTNAGCVSANGRFVAFESDAPGIGADPGGSIYIRDRKERTTMLASRQGGGDPASADTQSISANGRYVAFESTDDDLAGTDATTDVYRFDSKTEKTILLSRAKNGDPADDDAFYVSISAGGAYAAFTSRADNLSNKDDNAYSNTFVRGPLP